jgi:hypothetical protein
MRARGPVARVVVKWFGTLATLVLSLVFFYSRSRAISLDRSIVRALPDDTVVLGGDSRTIEFWFASCATFRGQVHIVSYHTSPSPGFAGRRLQTYAISKPGWSWWFDVTDRSGPPVASTTYGIPLWPLILGAGVPPVLLWRRDIRVWCRQRAGLCIACGHKRHGLPTDTLCPECSAAPTL